MRPWKDVRAEHSKLSDEERAKIDTEVKEEAARMEQDPTRFGTPGCAGGSARAPDRTNIYMTPAQLATVRALHVATGGERIYMDLAQVQELLASEAERARLLDANLRAGEILLWAALPCTIKKEPVNYEAVMSAAGLLASARLSTHPLPTATTAEIASTREDAARVCDEVEKMFDAGPAPKMAVGAWACGQAIRRGLCPHRNYFGPCGERCTTGAQDTLGVDEPPRLASGQPCAAAPDSVSEALTGKEGLEDGVCTLDYHQECDVLECQVRCTILGLEHWIATLKDQFASNQPRAAPFEDPSDSAPLDLACGYDNGSIICLNPRPCPMHAAPMEGLKDLERAAAVRPGMTSSKHLSALYFGDLCDVLFPESAGKSSAIGWPDLIARARALAAGTCGCIETWPQLQPGKINHGPGCARYAHKERAAPSASAVPATQMGAAPLREDQ